MRSARHVCVSANNHDCGAEKARWSLNLCTHRVTVLTSWSFVACWWFAMCLVLAVFGSQRRLSWRYAINPLCCATEFPRRNGDHNADGLELNVLTLACSSSILDGIVVDWMSVTSPLQLPRRFKSGDLDECHELASCPRSSCDATLCCVASTLMVSICVA